MCQVICKQRVEHMNVVPRFLHTVVKRLLGVVLLLCSIGTEIEVMA